jgi:hypothetical protein
VQSSQVTNLTMPLAETKFFRLCKAPAKAISSATFRTLKKKPATKASKAKAHAAPSSSSLPSALSPDIDMPGGLTKPEWLADDMINAIEVTIENVKDSDVDHSLVERSYLLCLEWAFTGKVTVSFGKVVLRLRAASFGAKSGSALVMGSGSLHKTFGSPAVA